jgi:hypothetical protein
MLPDGFYLTRETDNGTSPRHIPFLLVIGKESMHAIQSAFAVCGRAQRFLTQHPFHAVGDS